MDTKSLIKALLSPYSSGKAARAARTCISFQTEYLGLSRGGQNVDGLEARGGQDRPAGCQGRLKSFSAEILQRFLQEICTEGGVHSWPAPGS